MSLDQSLRVTESFWLPVPQGGDLGGLLPTHCSWILRLKKTWWGFSLVRTGGLPSG